MKTHSVFLAAAAILFSQGVASAQQPQNDNSGGLSVTPNRNAAPNTSNAGAAGSSTIPGGEDGTTSGASAAGPDSNRPGSAVTDGKNPDGSTSNLVPVTPGGLAPD